MKKTSLENKVVKVDNSEEMERPLGYVSAQDVLNLPAKEQDKIMEAAAILAEKEYCTTAESEFDCEETTVVTSIPENRTDFILRSKDVELMRSLASEHGMSYEAVIHMVIRDALDLYHWNHSRGDK